MESHSAPDPVHVMTSPSTGGENNNLNQPLLSSVRTTSSQHHQPPPAQAFFQIRDRNETEDHHDEETPVMQNRATANAYENRDEDGRMMAVVPRHAPLLGRRFVTDFEFWRRVVGVVLLGILTSASAEGIFWIIRIVKGQWFVVLNGHNDGDGAGSNRGDLSWIYTTLTGGFVTGLVLILGGHPKLPTIPHDFVRSISLKEALALVVAGTLSLASGAPLGPEVVILALSQLGVRLLRPLDASGTSVCFQHCGMVASVAAISGLPLLGPLLLLEILAAIVSSFQVVQGSGHFAEVLMLQVVASTSAASTREYIHSWSDAADESSMSSVSSTLLAVGLDALTGNASNGDNYVLMGFKVPESLYVIWLAPLIGLLCGLLGIFFLGTTRALLGLRHHVTAPLLGGPSPWFPALLFPTLAGIAHGLLAVLCPRAAGSGMELAVSLWEDTVTRTETVVEGNDLLKIVGVKLFSMALSVGFGLVGGAIIPAGSIGVYLGLWLYEWKIFQVLNPITLMSACMVGCTSAVAPIPLTGVAMVLILTSSDTAISSMSVSHLTSVLIVGVVSMGLSSGLVRSHAAATTGTVDNSSVTSGSLNDTMTTTDPMEGAVPSQSDEEILANVRQTIFAGNQ